MPFIFIGIAAFELFILSKGVNNIKAEGVLLKDEWFGANPYWKWAGALMIIGAIGYIPELEGVSTAFLVLVIVAIILAQSSGFNTLIKGL